MDLLLMRHADALDGNGSDYARVLSDKGKNQAESIGAWLRELDLGPIVIVSSPYPRAHQTGSIVADNLNGISIAQDERLAPGMTPDAGSALLHELGSDDGALLLVGHAPDLGNFASFLLGAKEGAVEMKKGAVACFHCVRPGLGGSELRWLVNPKLLT